MLFQSDPELQGRYVREGSEQSFAALVAAHESMLMGTSLRRTGDAELARDVAQQFFALLARKAAWFLGWDSYCRMVAARRLPRGGPGAAG